MCAKCFAQEIARIAKYAVLCSSQLSMAVPAAYIQFQNTKRLTKWLLYWYIGGLSKMEREWVREREREQASVCFLAEKKKKSSWIMLEHTLHNIFLFCTVIDVLRSGTRICLAVKTFLCFVSSTLNSFYLPDVQNQSDIFLTTVFVALLTTLCEELPSSRSNVLQGAHCVPILKFSLRKTTKLPQTL